MTEEEKKEGRIYPKLERVREISNQIAQRCIKLINKQGLAGDDGFTAKLSDKELHDWINSQMWVPTYKE